VDDSTGLAVVTEIGAELTGLWDEVAADGLDLATAERVVRERVLAIGARLLEAAVAARGTGQTGPRLGGRCGGEARFARYRTKEVQTLVGWITIRRAA
jgi:hypothetical protein